jgi:hypothetical protein
MGSSFTKKVSDCSLVIVDRFYCAVNEKRIREEGGYLNPVRLLLGREYERHRKDRSSERGASRN